VGPDVGVGETEHIWSEPLCRRLQVSGEEACADVASFVIDEDGADETVSVTACIGQDSSGDASPHENRAEDREPGGVLMDSLVSNVRLLQLERDGDGSG
jgi:hypothetical protein